MMWLRIKRLEQPRRDTNGREEKGEPQIDADVPRFGLAAYPCAVLRPIMWLRTKRLEQPRMDTNGRGRKRRTAD